MLLVQQVQKLLELILQFSRVASGGGCICGGCLCCGGRSAGRSRSRAGAAAGGRHRLWPGTSLETGLQIVVVTGRGLHIVTLRLLGALLVMQIDETIAFLQYLCRLGGIARDAVRGDGVVGALCGGGKVIRPISLSLSIVYLLRSHDS